MDNFDSIKSNTLNKVVKPKNLVDYITKLIVCDNISLNVICKNEVLRIPFSALNLQIRKFQLQYNWF